MTKITKTKENHREKKTANRNRFIRFIKGVLLSLEKCTGMYAGICYSGMWILWHEECVC